MRLDEDAKERIRRSYSLDRKSMRRIALEEGYSRLPIEKAITNQFYNPYRLTRPKASPIFGPYQERAEDLLHENEHLPRKQRYTVTLKAYPFTVEILDESLRLASHPRCYQREQDVFNPLH